MEMLGIASRWSGGGWKATDQDAIATVKTFEKRLIGTGRNDEGTAHALRERSFGLQCQAASAHFAKPRGWPLF